MCSRYRPGVAQRVGRGIALLFHDRGTRRGWVVSSTPQPHFTPGKDPVLILQETGWAPWPVWTGGKSRPHRDSIPDRPARSSVAISTELPGPRLSGQYKGINMNVKQYTRRHIQEYCNLDIRNYLFYNDRLIWFSEVHTSILREGMSLKMEWSSLKWFAFWRTAGVSHKCGNTTRPSVGATTISVMIKCSCMLRI